MRRSAREPPALLVAPPPLGAGTVRDQRRQRGRQPARGLHAPALRALPGGQALVAAGRDALQELDSTQIAPCDALTTEGAANWTPAVSPIPGVTMASDVCPGPCNNTYRRRLALHENEVAKYAQALETRADSDPIPEPPDDIDR